MIYPDRIVDELGLCFQNMFFLAQGYGVTPECTTFANTLLEMSYGMFGMMIFAAFLGYVIMNKGFVISKEPIKFNMQALDIGTNLTNLFKKRKCCWYGH